MIDKCSGEISMLILTLVKEDLILKLKKNSNFSSQSNA